VYRKSAVENVQTTLLVVLTLLFILCLVLNGRAIATTQKKLKAIPPQLQDIQAAQAGGHCQTKLSYSKPNHVCFIFRLPIF
jgi:hypothetical protein